MPSILGTSGCASTYKKIPSNLNISAAGVGCLPSQEAESKARLLTHHWAAHCQAALCLYPLHSRKRDKEKHEMARKGWLNLKIISQGSKKKPPWLSISKFVKSPLVIKVKMAWVKARLWPWFPSQPWPRRCAILITALLFTPDLIFCAIPFGFPSKPLDCWKLFWILTRFGVTKAALYYLRKDTPECKQWSVLQPDTVRYYLFIASPQMYHSSFMIDYLEYILTSH